MEHRRCESCLKLTAQPVCEHCGYPVNKQNGRHQLPVGTVLGGRYRIGRVLGQGGFGITYLGWDLQTGETVAVKEFYPGSMVNRDCSKTKYIQCNTSQMEPHYRSSRERFLREAKALAQLRDVPEIVSIQNFLEENNTAYIVMEYVQGMDLEHYLQHRGGRLTPEETFRILRPVMEALAKVHQHGLIHRDVSPDNIILHPTGGAKILDFGAVRSVENPEQEKALAKSTEAILKHGFAPIEQYQTRGSLGPWTDEYAMCATIYFCLTGRIIEEAPSRMAEELAPNWANVPGLTPEQKKVLNKGLAVRAKDRFSGMEELIAALFPQSAPQPIPQPVPQPRPQPRPDPRPQPKPEPRPQPRPDSRPQPKPEPRPQPRPDSGARMAADPMLQQVSMRPARKKNRLPLILGIVGAMVVAGVVLWLILSGRPGKDGKPQEPTPGTQETTPTVGANAGELPAAGENTFTYHTAQDVFPTNWSPFACETAEDMALLDSVSAALYTFDYNASSDGYALVPEMASGMPEDVTAQYIGSYGLKHGDTQQAWRITLREDLCWEDGKPITARDFTESAKRLLDPRAENPNASLLYEGRFQGNLPVYGAHSYYLDGKSQFLENAANEGYSESSLIRSGGSYLTPRGEQVYLAVDMPLEEWLSGYTLKEYVDSYGAEYFSLTYWDQLVSMMDENGLIPLTEENRRMFLDVITGNPNWGESENELYYYFVYCTGGESVPWEQVGILAPGDRELILILEKPVAGFDLLVALSNSWLVDTEVYDALAITDGGTYSNSYGTSPETTRSFGPYRLTDFRMDEQYVLERSELFFDLTQDTYQATGWTVTYVDDMDDQLDLFLRGQLDETPVPSAALSRYIESPELLYTTSETVYGIVFNPDLQRLQEEQQAAGANINKTILTIPQFRMVLSLGMDRAAFALAAAPGNKPAMGLFPDYAISDPEQGIPYRSTTPAKEALTAAWGLEDSYGEGKTFPDLDAAEASITGYDPDRARMLLEEAYAMALEQGLMDGDDKVLITVGMPGDSDFYTNGFAFLQRHYAELVKGTSLEGRLEFAEEMLGQSSYSEALRGNAVDMLFGVGWSGNALDPYNLMDAYIHPDYQYDPSTDYNAQELTVTIGGEAYTASVYTWNMIMSGQLQQVRTARGTYQKLSFGPQDGNPEARLQILAAMERAVLENYCFIPIMDDASAMLHSRQISYPSREYTYGLGFGGIKYLRFNYSDAQWDTYVADRGGQIDYTQ